jgi:ATP-dependent DNA helicase PIF1
MTQKTALAILKTGRNAFLTGEPGSGKTHTVNRYVAWLEEHRIVPAVTASTGIAATHVGGMTIHSWSGIGIRQSLTTSELKQLAEKDTLMRRMLRASVLIIDEISMLDGRTLATVDAACRAVRQQDKPFGGLQTVFVGDFFQLPPVWRLNTSPQQTLMGSPDGPMFAFRSSAWQAADPAVCYLSEQHRQEDARFRALLSGVRRGQVDEDGRALLGQCRVSSPDDAVHTRLYSHNADVDRVNNERLKRLSGEPRAFQMRAKGPERYVLQLKKSCLSPEELVLKTGARVMFTKNQPECGFVNGTLGEVAGFDDEDGAPVVKTTDGRRIFANPAEWAMTDGSRTLAKIMQFPLRLAWAITVHKSQGMTLDAAVVDLSRAFEYGQGYVALSRVRSSQGLCLLGWNERALLVHPDILAVDDRFKRQSADARSETERRASGEQEEREKAFITACGGSVRSKGKKHRFANPFIDASDVRRPRAKRPKGPSTRAQTLALFREGKSLAEIAAARGFTVNTIVSHLQKLSMDDAVTKEELARLVPAPLADAAPAILDAFRSFGDGCLTPVFETFGGAYSYDDLKIVRLLM